MNHSDCHGAGGGVRMRMVGRGDVSQDGRGAFYDGWVVFYDESDVIYG